MYLYYDKNNILKEIINDEAIVRLSANTIYIFYERYATGADPTVSASFRLSNDTEINALLTDIKFPWNGEGTAPEEAYIPYNPDRDLKYFKYGTPYRFVKMTLGTGGLTDVLSINGVVAGTVTYDVQHVLELFTFMVEQSVVPTEYISISQYYYLLELFKNKNVIAVTDIDSVDLSNYEDNSLLIDTTSKKVWKINNSAKVEWVDLADIAILTAGLAAHIADTSNPHQVTKAQVGLGNVENTGDSDTPVEGGLNKFTTGGAYLLENSLKGYTDAAIANFKVNEFSLVNTTTYPTLESFLATTGNEGYIYLYPVDITQPSLGYYQYIWENNSWLSLGTTRIDLNNYVTVDTVQTISGTKTFTGGVSFNGTLKVDNNDLGQGAKIEISGNDGEGPDKWSYLEGITTTYPYLHSTSSFGVNEDLHVERDLYIRRKLYAGEYELTLPEESGQLALVGDIPPAYIYRGTRTCQQISNYPFEDITTDFGIGGVVNISDSGTITWEYPEGTTNSITVVAGDNIAWTGTAWDKLAGTIDLSGYVLKTTTISGIDLQDNITAQELTDALVFMNNTTDMDYVMED